ncbi:MAG: phage tail sheath family protein [Oscillospiraceae bacterium]
MAEYLSPGVYVEEFDSGSKSMEGVGTSTAGFIGLAERGSSVGVPQLVTSFSDFKRKFGGYLSANEFGEYRFLAYSVEHFFINGGSRCFISRVVPNDAKSSSAENTALKVVAKNEGTWGNDVVIEIVPSSKAKTQVLEISSDNSKQCKVKKSNGFNVGDIVAFNIDGSVAYNRIVKSKDNVIEFEEDLDATIVDTNIVPKKIISTCECSLTIRYDDQIETYENVSFNIKSSNFIEKCVEKSNLVDITVNTSAVSKLDTPFNIITENADVDSFRITLANGSNGSLAEVTPDTFIGVDNGAGNRTGIQSFIDNDVVSIIAVPGVTDSNVQLNLVAHCENLASRFAVLDMPQDCIKVDDVIAHRNIVDSTYSAMYHPWLEVYDPLDKKNVIIPPSGSVMGIYSRTDNTKGVHKAPANEVVRACTGLSIPFNKGEQDILNPKGVNLIRSFPGQGIRVWGARTTSSDPSWKYINVRRLFIFIEESIKANTNWVVFEPNTPELWDRVQRTINGFLTSLWRSGALAGTSESEAFFCNVDNTTMTKDDIDNGRLICVIGVAPVKPAEFVIFRISQKTGE